MFGGLWLIAWLDGYAHVGAPSLWMLGILAALALVVDYLAAVLGVKRVGASGLAKAVVEPGPSVRVTLCLA